jgi:hypothetical protein
MRNEYVVDTLDPISSDVNMMNFLKTGGEK